MRRQQVVFAEPELGRDVGRGLRAVPLQLVEDPAVRGIDGH